jgi:hypothetical protein
VLLLTVTTVVCNFTLPFFPIDETRYLTVAWEMKLNNSFIVPILNGLPYSHKPPLLFWLINLDWFLLGVNEGTLRFIPLFFSIINLSLVYKISLLLWKDRTTAKYATIILSSMLLYLIFSALIMFDIILTFWVLLGIYGILKAANNNGVYTFILIGIAIGGGLLTKGPVIFLHILPICIFYTLWKQSNYITTKQWYLGILISVIIGIFIALIWAIPAIFIGGETYKEAILWGQTVNRIKSSFAHQRPFWWYIPLIPILSFPWIFVKSSWPTFAIVKENASYRFLIIWILSTFILFSLISGKQIHYLIPILPAVSLLMARNIGTSLTKPIHFTKAPYFIAIFYFILGIGVITILPHIKLGSDIGSIETNIRIWFAIGCILMGLIMLIMRINSTSRLITLISTTTLCMVILIIIIGKDSLNKQFNVKPIANILKAKEKEGYQIIHFKDYAGQFHFLGRISKPFTIVKNKKNISDSFNTFEKVLLITYEKQNMIIDDNDVVFQQLFRNRKVVLWNENGIHHFLISTD